jgi:urea transport system ATP-binding protein
MSFDARARIARSGGAKPKEPRREAVGEHPTIVYLEDIAVKFGNFTALDIKAFYVDRSELRFLIGPNGAGKTTLLDVICRKTEPAKGGKMLYGDSGDLRQFSVSQVARAGISRKFQAPSVFGELSVRQNMELSYPEARSVFSGFRYRPSAEATGEIDAMLEMTRLGPFADARAQELSHGQKQWLEIGLTLMQKPALLLVDEPAAGMSAAERQATGRLLSDAARNCAVLIVEHDMNFVKSFAKTVSVLHEGRIICEGSFDHVSRDPQVIDVYLGRGGSPVQAAAKEAGHA